MIQLCLFCFLSEINFQCLGDWVGHNGERYMALLDVQDSTAVATAGGVSINGAERRPRYRCAVRYPFLFFFHLVHLITLFGRFSETCSGNEATHFSFFSVPLLRDV